MLPASCLVSAAPPSLNWLGPQHFQWAPACRPGTAQPIKRELYPCTMHDADKGI